MAAQTGWFLFAGVYARYLANQIFLDGNTFDNDDQDSMEYDNEALGVTLGVTYAWQNYSLAFSINDLNVIDDNHESGEYSRIGSLTLAWKHD